jgi:hypothetical protein
MHLGDDVAAPEGKPREVRDIAPSSDHRDRPFRLEAIDQHVVHLEQAGDLLGNGGEHLAGRRVPCHERGHTA